MAVGALRIEPVETEGRRRPGSALWRGTVSMFESAGFQVVARHRESPTAAVRAVVRRSLRAGDD